MSTYKVIQDIEAEDHILGPFSLRQFIFMLIAILCFYFCYLVASKGAAFLIAIFLPPGLFAGFFAIPFGRDQPTEIWALAKIRFFIKPRRRIWDQSGVKELVTVTAPKKVIENRSNGLSQTEVHSRLSALANTIDSRGWAVKNVNVNMYAQQFQQADVTDSDRLVDLSSTPQQVPDYDVQASDDILDEQNNPIAQQFEQLISTSEQSHRQKLQAMMASASQQDTSTPATPAQTAQPASTNDYWFMNEPVAAPVQQPVAQQPPVVATSQPTSSSGGSDATTPTAAEAAVIARVKQQKQQEQASAAFGRMKTIQPIDEQNPVAVAAAPAQPTPKVPNPATALAGDNDKNIDVIAREAKRINHQSDKLSDDGEVVISLH